MKNKIITSLLILLATCTLTSCVTPDIGKLNQRAVQLMNEGKVDDAISRLESIDDLNPNIPETNYNLGIAYFKKQNYEKAIEKLNKCIKLKTNFAEAYYTLGVAYEDYAYSIVEKAEEAKQKIDNKIMTELLTKSYENYEKYTTLSKSSKEQEQIKEKLKQLSKDIEKYSGD